MPTHDEPTADHDELLNLNEAVALLKTSRATFNRWLRSGRLNGTKVGRQWRFRRSEIERFLQGQAQVVDAGPGVAALLAGLLEQRSAFGAEAPAPTDEADPLRSSVDAMIMLALDARATHLCIEPHARAEGPAKAMLRFRVDGVMRTIAEIEISDLPGLVTRWKQLAACNPHERDKIQEGWMKLVAGPDLRELHLRVTFLPVGLGESLSVVILDATEGRAYADINRIGYSEPDQARLRQSLARPFGLVIVTGPSGCGKTTTLYAALMELAGPEIKVVSIEDPVELALPGVLQIPVRPDSGVTIAAAIRAALRCDPDVLLVGEVRDHESLRLCQLAALTGRLVLTNLHAPDTVQALQRMAQFGDPADAAAATTLVAAQRLIRQLCPDCKTSYAPSREALENMRQLAVRGGLEWAETEACWHRPVGCPSCGQTGYRGRSTLSETLEMTPAIARLLRNDADGEQLLQAAVDEGMTTLAADGVRKAAAGVTTFEEVARVLGLPQV